MRRLLLTALIALALLGATSTSAVAADGPVIELSRDGVTWSQDLDEPLFDPAMRWVPGDSETSSFFVRNQGGTAGDLAVDIIGTGNEQALLDSGDLHVTAQGGGGEWQTVSGRGENRLLTALDLADGSVARISVNVTFDEGSTTPTQLEFASFAFRVTLSQSVDAPVGDDGGPGDAAGGDKGVTEAIVDAVLPATGAADMRWVLAIAAILLGSGSAIVVDSRRGERDV